LVTIGLLYQNVEVFVHEKRTGGEGRGCIAFILLLLGLI